MSHPLLTELPALRTRESATLVLLTTSAGTALAQGAMWLAGMPSPVHRYLAVAAAVLALPAWVAWRRARAARVAFFRGLRENIRAAGASTCAEDHDMTETASAPTRPDMDTLDEITDGFRPVFERCMAKLWAEVRGRDPRVLTGLITDEGNERWGAGVAAADDNLRALATLGSQTPSAPLRLELERVLRALRTARREGHLRVLVFSPQACLVLDVPAPAGDLGVLDAASARA